MPLDSTVLNATPHSMQTPTEAGHSVVAAWVLAPSPARVQICAPSPRDSLPAFEQPVPLHSFPWPPLLPVLCLSNPFPPFTTCSVWFWCRTLGSHSLYANSVPNGSYNRPNSLPHQTWHSWERRSCPSWLRFPVGSRVPGTGRLSKKHFLNKPTGDV